MSICSTIDGGPQTATSNGDANAPHLYEDIGFYNEIYQSEENVNNGRGAYAFVGCPAYSASAGSLPRSMHITSNKDAPLVVGKPPGENFTIVNCSAYNGVESLGSPEKTGPGVGNPKKAGPGMGNPEKLGPGMGNPDSIALEECPAYNAITTPPLEQAVAYYEVSLPLTDGDGYELTGPMAAEKYVPTAERHVPTAERHVPTAGRHVPIPTAERHVGQAEPDNEAPVDTDDASDSTWV